MYLAKQLTQKSLPEIGELFGVSITRPCCTRCARSRWTVPRTMADQPGAKIGYIDVDIEQNLHALGDGRAEGGDAAGDQRSDESLMALPDPFRKIAVTHLLHVLRDGPLPRLRAASDADRAPGESGCS
jgi:hypothetical protein